MRAHAEHKKPYLQLCGSMSPVTARQYSGTSLKRTLLGQTVQCNLDYLDTFVQGASAGIPDK